jgi:hypothetical protein
MDIFYKILWSNDRIEIVCLQDYEEDYYSMFLSETKFQTEEQAVEFICGLSPTNMPDNLKVAVDEFLAKCRLTNILDRIAQPKLDLVKLLIRLENHFGHGKVSYYIIYNEVFSVRLPTTSNSSGRISIPLFEPDFAKTTDEVFDSLVDAIDRLTSNTRTVRFLADRAALVDHLSPADPFSADRFTPGLFPPVKIFSCADIPEVDLKKDKRPYYRKFSKSKY